MQKTGALTELRVVEISRRVAGGLAGVLLADQGADVVALDLAGVTEPDKSWRARGKRRVAVAEDTLLEVRALLARADVVIDDLPQGALAAAGLDVAAARLENPGLIWCQLPGFHASDPRAGGLDPEGAVCAASGIYEVPLSRQPAYTPIPIGSIVAALYGVCGVLGAMMARRRDGVGQDVTVPRSDAAVTAQELLALFLVDPPKVWDTLRWAASPFITNWRCRDGRWIFVHVGLGPHLTRLMETLEGLGEAEAAEALRASASLTTRRDPSAVGSVFEARRLRRAMATVFKRRDADEWERLLSDAGLCAAVCRTPAEWLDCEHALASGQVVTLGGRRQPGVQVSVRDAPGAVVAGEEAQLAEVDWSERVATEVVTEVVTDGAPDAGAPLAGLKVMDFTQVIAGPVTARTLAELGAEVLRIENPRMTAGWVEPFHVAFNRGKRSVTMDLTTEVGREAMWTLAEAFKPDVVLHNLRPGAAEALGLGEDAWTKRVGPVVYTHLTAYGTEGPWGQRPGWEQTAQAAAGVQVAYGGEDAPDLYPLPLNDLGTGLAGAFASLLGLYRRAQTGEGQRAQTCLTSTATLLMSELACPTEDAPAPTSLGAGALERFYKASDGWFFLSVRAADFHRLSGIAGLTGLAGRTPDRSGDLLASLFGDTSVDVWRARVGAAELSQVVSIQRWCRRSAVLRDPALRTRGLVTSREHPTLGPITEVESPLTLSHTPTLSLPVARERGGDGPPPTGLVVAGEAATSGGALGWIVRQVTWAVYLLTTRL